MFDTEWVVIFEDDVITKNNKIQFPNSDSVEYMYIHGTRIN